VETGTVSVKLVSPEDFKLTGDPERLTTAIRNLIENAVKYTLLKDPSLKDAIPPIELSWQPRAGKGGRAGIELLVRDRGIGISASELGRVFETFYRVDRSRTKLTGGFGLGLSLAKRLIEEHGGQLSLESREGEGTLARVWLPQY
jgi:two-component system phosphate regulon sensor histidine kinase PhoR